MMKVDQKEEIRVAHYVKGQSIRQIAREQQHARATVRKALGSAEEEQYTPSKPRAAPVLGAYRGRIDEMLSQNEHLPRKQRYTTHRMYKQVEAEGYGGSESTVRAYVWQKRKQSQRLAVYVPLGFDPGSYAQVDWGEAEVEMCGQRETAQFFVMRMCYSRRMFVRAYPTQKQEAFLDGHVEAFHFFGGVPHTVVYDNLTTAVQEILQGKRRTEQRQFIALRSHYLFESRFCTPGEGHEKGGVESDVGYARRNYLSPPPQASSWEELNRRLLKACVEQDSRVVSGQARSVGEMWQEERACLRGLPPYPFACCVRREVTVNGYSQVEFETNHYSVPSEEARKHVTIRAYPFCLQIWYENEMLTSHERSYRREQEIMDPLHYLALLEQRPGAFEHARPMREWRKTWPPLYEQLLAKLQAAASTNGCDASWAIREFVRILKLLKQHPIEEVEEAMDLALTYGCVHYDGVQLCLRQVQHPEVCPAALDLAQQPHLQAAGTQTINLREYEQLLSADAGGAMLPAGGSA